MKNYIKYYENPGKTIEKQSKKWWGRYRDADGVERRIPLSSNKNVSQQMLNDLVKHAIRCKTGLIHPAELEMKKPIRDHLADFEKSLKSRNNTKRYIHDCIAKIERCIDDCSWKTPAQIKPTDVERFLVELRDVHGCSIQTSNHYLRVLKGFCRWLYLNKRLVDQPLLSLAMLNARTDRRHDRRALTEEEFTRLLDAAESGPPVEGLTGPDRAMLYMLAGWTGFRKGELGSLTLKSFDFSGETAFVIVDAGYSKHRREDRQALHPDIAARFKQWIARKKPEQDELLFPISHRCGGVERKASKMMKFDLDAARTFWIAESKTPEDEKKRISSDVLVYRDEKGKFADFHGLRHTFITNLGRAGVSLKTAQTLARHSDIKLTLDIYTHVDQEEQIQAINALPSPEGKKEEPEDKKKPRRKPK